MAKKSRNSNNNSNSPSNAAKKLNTKPPPRSVSAVSATSSFVVRKKKAKKRRTKSSEENGSGDASKLPPPMGGEYTHTIPPFVGYIRHTLTKRRLPAYTFAARTTPPGFVPKHHASPGPARYGIAKNLTCHGGVYDGGITMGMGREHDGPNRSRLISQAVHEQLQLQEAEAAAATAAAAQAPPPAADTAPSTLNATQFASSTAAGSGGAPRHGTPAAHKLAKTTAQIVATAYQQHAIPGPGTYKPEQFPDPKFDRAPAWSTAGRLHTLNPLRFYPSPAEYKLPSVFGPHVVFKPSAPAAGLGERTKYGGVEISDRLNAAEGGPGPARYGMPNPDRVMWSNGDGVSIKSRPHERLNEEGKKSYWFGTMDVSKNKAPKFSFGIKHSVRQRNF